jgi:ureidoglycolate lyase
MKKISVIELEEKSFKVYGSFSNMINPDSPKLGPPPVEFYRDVSQITLGQSTIPSFSITRITPRPLVIEKFEYHNFTGEAFLPLDGDVFVHLAPAGHGDNISYDKIEVFRIPKGMLVTLHPGVWHQAPYCGSDAVVNVLVVLPERTYENDCNVICFPEENKLQIEEL